MSIPGTASRRPVAVAMLFLAVILLGGISFVRLPIDLLPDVAYPRLVVFSRYPDVAPAEVERLVTERVEAAAAAVSGQERVTSVSREGVSLVTVTFRWGTDMDFAVLSLREEMDNLRETLPTGVRPSILRVDPESEPVLALSVAGGDLWQTKELAETVFRRRLEQLDGVAQAAVTGGLDREIQVDVRPGLLDAYGVSMAEVARALAAANVSLPGGFVTEGRYRYPLRTLGEFTSVEQIADVVVARRATDGGAVGGAAGGDGVTDRLVRLRDVARVVDGFAERDAVARYAGAEAVGILVFKESGANTVAVAEAVDEVLGQLALEYPSVSVDVAQSQATFIAESISNVVQALVVGGLLAFLVLFFFLRDARYPFAIATSIPISVVGTFALMEAAGVSLNVMSLGGLALGVGMLVDNSIVVLENVFRHREEGRGMLEAAALGAEEVQGAITASTLTTISVFGPIVYVEGVAGELFGDLSLAVAFSLVASLVVALTLLPALAARFDGRAADAPTPAPALNEPPRGVGRRRRVLDAVTRAVGGLARGAWALSRDLLVFWGKGVSGLLGRLGAPLLRGFDRVFGAFQAGYHAVLVWALDHRARVVALSGAALALSLALAATLPRDLLPEVDQGAFDVRLRLPEGTGLGGTLEAAIAVEALLLSDPGVSAVFTRVGRDVRAYAEGEEETGLNTATLQARVAEGEVTAAVVARLRPATASLPVGAEVSFETGRATALGRLLGGSEADIAVRVLGEDLDTMRLTAERVEARLSSLPGLANVRIGTAPGTPQIQVEIRRDAAARYGLEPAEVAAAIDRAMRGERATEYLDFDKKIAVVVRYPEALRTSRETLASMRIAGVPLRELVEVEEAVGPAEVRREDQGRVLPVYADVAEGGLDRAITRIEEELSRFPPSTETRLEVGGENEQMRRSFRDLAFAFGLALILVYMILAAQFESFVHPLTILTAVPLSLVGATLALALTGQGLNTMSLIGVVILVGIVVNDAIVKVDFINQGRQAGRSVREAVLEAGRVRLRPILMTTLTTVLGLLPMALGIGSGADLRAPLAIAVIGGLMVATLLTLVVIPVVYAIVEEARERVRGLEPVPLPGGLEGAAEGSRS